MDAGLADLTGPSRLWTEPELGVWRRAAVTALAQVDPSLIAPPAGDPMLRDELAALVGVDRERVVVTAGVRAAAAPLMRRCDETVVERPTFLGVPRALRRDGLVVRTEPWERLWTPRGARTGYWFTAPCRNPDGRSPDDGFLATATAAAGAGLRVVCNTTYRWFGRVPPLPTAVLQVGSLHKLAGRGACLGWVIADPSDETPLAAPPLHWQRTWGHFLAAGGVDLLLRRHGKLHSARMAFLKPMGIAELVGAQEGPNILLPTLCPEEEAVTRLAEVGVRVSPGSAFGALQPSIRVCLTHIDPATAAAAGERTMGVLGRLSLGRLSVGRIAPDAGSDPAVAGGATTRG